MNNDILYELADWVAETWANGEAGKSRRIYGVLMRNAHPHPVPDYWDDTVRRKIRYYKLLRGGE